MAVVRALVVAGAVLGVSVPVAFGARFEGRTSAGQRAVVDTSDRGLPVFVGVQWRARCGDGGRVRARTGFWRPFDERSRTAVRDAGSYSFRVRDSRTGRSLRVRVRRASVEARRVGRDRWEGTFGAKMVVRRDGRVVSRCRTGRITWRASR